MHHFDHDGVSLAFADTGTGRETVLVIHGFASSYHVNWEATGWTRALAEAGYRVVGIDNRGHGASEKLYDPEAYHPSLMAGDAVALLDHLDIADAHVLGYSMGARVSAFVGMEHGGRVRTLTFGGLGIGMVEGVGDWDVIADALLAEDVMSITDLRGMAFRKFADQTKSDRHALAACIRTSRQLIGADEIAHIDAPALVAVGTRDDIAGDPHKLAALLPNGEGFDIEGRDHMLAVGDRSFKKAVLEFLEANP